MHVATRLVRQEVDRLATPQSTRTRSSKQMPIYLPTELWYYILSFLRRSDFEIDALARTMIEDSPLSTIFSATPVPTSDKYNDTWWHDKYEAWDEGEDIYVTTFDIAEPVASCPLYVAMVKGHEDHEYMATNCDIVSLLLSAPSASSVHGKEIIRQTQRTAQLPGMGTLQELNAGTVTMYTPVIERLQNQS